MGRVGAPHAPLAPAIRFADAAAVTLGPEARVSLGVVAGARMLPDLR